MKYFKLISKSGQVSKMSLNSNRDDFDAFMTVIKEIWPQVIEITKAECDSLDTDMKIVDSGESR